jgi:hypothetical protein
MDELSLYYAVKAHSQHTIGVEFSSRTVKLGEKRIKLQVCSYLWRVSLVIFGLNTQPALGYCGTRTIPVREALLLESELSS